MTRSRWVCLMYHDVTPAPSATGGGASFFSVSRAGFERQLEAIEAMGLRGCSIAEVVEHGPVGRVAITFDDGDLGQAERAFPALAARGMTATFFVTTSWVGRPGYASWDQLRAMRDAGMSIQSHTHTHPFLSELAAGGLRDELGRSRELLDTQLGQRTTMLALPGGDAPRSDLHGLLAETGYAVVATSRWGVNDALDAPMATVRRCTVRGEPSAELFAAIVRGSAWLGAKKRFRESTLAFVRSTLGPTRYARWRRRFLDAGRVGAASR